MLGTYALRELPVDFALLAAAFCGTALVYLVDRERESSLEDRVNHPERLVWVASHRGWLAVEAAVLFAAGCASVFYLSWPVLVAAVVLGTAAGLHVFPRESGLGQHGGIVKPVSIAGAWAVGASILPLLGANDGVGFGGLLFALYRFLFILPNLLLADWADRSGDLAAGSSSWTSGWSGRRVRWVATGLLGAALCGAGFWIVAASQPVLVAIDAVGMILMVGVVWRLEADRPSHAFLANVAVGWPAVTALTAVMMV